MRALLRFLKRVFASRPIPSLAATILLASTVVTLVPVRPFTPTCGLRFTTEERRITGRMTPEDRTALTDAFPAWGTIHWSIGGDVLVPLMPVLFYDGFEWLDAGEAMVNAETKAAARLVKATYVGSYVGREPLGCTYHPPDYFTGFIDPQRRDVSNTDCAFVRAVALGEQR